MRHKNSKTFKIRLPLSVGRISLTFALAALMFVGISIMKPPANSEALTAADPSTIAACGGNPECFAFTVDTTLDLTGGHTGTSSTFSIPTSGYVGGAALPQWSYNWIVNFGDYPAVGTAPGSCVDAGNGNGDYICTGTSSTQITSPGISITYTYATPGSYQITIRPNAVTPAAGWMNAFGFIASSAAEANRCMFFSIDTPLTNLMRTQGSAYRFAHMFSGARNAVGIPDNLFAGIPGNTNNVSTAGNTDLSRMFFGTFSYFAYNSTTATIPAGLFSTINTASCTNFREMFSGTVFVGSEIIGTFSYFAYNSTTATIPAGLFSTINTANGTNFRSMFNGTFNRYAFNSTVGTIPSDLFSSIDTSRGTDFTYMFSGTFGYYAQRTATFMVGGAVVNTRTFTNPYSTKNTTTDNTPSSNPTVNAGDVIVPTYNASARSIAKPTSSTYASHAWYRTDGTSCLVAIPTPNCGPQTLAQYVTFPNATEWMPTTDTEKGNVTFYSGPVFAIVSDKTVAGWTSVNLVPQTVTITLGGPTVKTAIAAGTDISSWFTNLPAGLTATVTTAVSAGATTIPVTFTGVPTATSSAVMAITIPAAALSSGAALGVTTNTDAVWNIVTALATMSGIVAGWTGTPIASGQTVTIALTDTAILDGAAIRLRIAAGTDISSWFTNLPDGLTATMAAVAEAGDTTVSVTFSGTPTVDNTDPIAVTIPAAQLVSGADLEVASDPDTRWDIVTAIAGIDDAVITGTVGETLVLQTANINLTNTTTDQAIPSGTDISSWFTNLPAGLKVVVGANVAIGDTTIPVIFSGTPIVTSNNVIATVIPADYLSSGADLAVATNINARYNIANKPGLTPPVIPGAPNTGLRFK